MGIEHPADGVGAVARGRTAAHDVDMVNRVGVEREKILIRALSIKTRVHPNPIEKHDGLLSRTPAKKCRTLSMRGLLHEYAGLITKRIRGRPGQSFIHVPTVDARSRPVFSGLRPVLRTLDDDLQGLGIIGTRGNRCQNENESHRRSGRDKPVAGRWSSVAQRATGRSGCVSSNASFDFTTPLARSVSALSPKTRMVFPRSSV